jgi:hypothetical protein
LKKERQTLTFYHDFVITKFPIDNHRNDWAPKLFELIKNKYPTIITRGGSVAVRGDKEEENFDSIKVVKCTKPEGILSYFLYRKGEDIVDLFSQKIFASKLNLNIPENSPILLTDRKNLIFNRDENFKTVNEYISYYPHYQDDLAIIKDKNAVAVLAEIERLNDTKHNDAFLDF